MNLFEWIDFISGWLWFINIYQWERTCWILYNSKTLLPNVSEYFYYFWYFRWCWPIFCGNPYIYIRHELTIHWMYIKIEWDVETFSYSEKSPTSDEKKVCDLFVYICAWCSKDRSILVTFWYNDTIFLTYNSHISPTV